MTFSIMTLSIPVLIAVMLSLCWVSQLFKCYAEYHYAESRYAECNDAELGYGSQTYTRPVNTIALLDPVHKHGLFCDTQHI